LPDAAQDTRHADLPSPRCYGCRSALRRLSSTRPSQLLIQQGPTGSGVHTWRFISARSPLSHGSRCTRRRLAPRRVRRPEVPALGTTTNDGRYTTARRWAILVGPTMRSSTSSVLLVCVSAAVTHCAGPQPVADSGVDTGIADSTTDTPTAPDEGVMDVATDQPSPADTGIDSRPPADTGVDTGVAPRDTGVRDTGLPPCTLDPRNCGMCGRICGEGSLTSRPACAEVATGRWDCVNGCAGFGEGCQTQDGRGVCCPSGCGPINTGCR
jgi:hypothetical protein